MKFRSLSFLLNLSLILSSGSSLYAANFADKARTFGSHARRMAICAFKPNLDPKSPCSAHEIKEARIWVAGTSIATITTILSAIGLGALIYKAKAAKEETNGQASDTIELTAQNATPTPPLASDLLPIRLRYTAGPVFLSTTNLAGVAKNSSKQPVTQESKVKIGLRDFEQLKKTKTLDNTSLISNGLAMNLIRSEMANFIQKVKKQYPTEFTTKDRITLEFYDNNNPENKTKISVDQNILKSN